MTSHTEYRLDQLGISSQYEADRIERDLDIRFDQFTFYDREVWNQQNSYLEAYAYTGAVSDAADAAGITISTTHEWKFLNTLGFKHRLEDAVLRFSDSLHVIALERAREPNSPASLLIALLRAHMPEKYSANGHRCDTSKADDDSRFRYIQDAQRERESGNPTFRALAEGAHEPPQDSPYSDLSPTGPEDSTYSNLSPGGGEIQRGGSSPHPSTPSAESPHDDIQPVDPDEVAFFNLPLSEQQNTPHPSVVNPHTLSPSEQPSVGAGFKPAHDLSLTGPEDSPHHPTAPPAESPHDDIQPVDPDEVAFFNLPPTDQPSVGAGFKPAHDLCPTGEETQRGGSSPTPTAPPEVRPPGRLIASLFQKSRPNPDNDLDTFKVRRF